MPRLILCIALGATAFGWAAACAAPQAATTATTLPPVAPAGAATGQHHPGHDVADRSAAYRATIRRTGHGIPHIEAEDLGSLGFGEGYAQAEDHLCSIADQVVRARGERARYIGRGPDDVHVAGDIAMRGLRLVERGQARHDAQPAEVRQWLGGYVAGYNLYLRETGRDRVAGWCRGEPWVGPITTADLSAYHLLLTLTAPAFARAIAGARPPEPAGPAVDASTLPPDLPGPGPTASNGWALGRDLTETGRGMLLANPHYPWIGSNRFWEKHLTVPGDLDVYGANLLGIPGAGIGFNDAVAWTHTVSDGIRFTLYALDLVPGDPTRYRYGDEERAMTPVDVSVHVRGKDEPVTHTVWFTHYGPVIATGPLAWTGTRAFSIRDATEGVDSYPAQLLAMQRAGSMADLQAAYAAYQGIPRFTTVAVSADGVAWFIDSSATPHLDDQVLADWVQRRERDPVTRQLWQNSRIVLLDGSDPGSEWLVDPASPHPGLVPFHRLPQIERTDHVFNANNSFWAPHAEARVEGDYSPLLGAQREPLSLRARANALTLANATSDQPAGEDGRFTREALQDAILGNRSLAADLLVPELVRRCAATPVVQLDGTAADLAPACGVLAGWDRTFDLDSRGAVLFREWIGRYQPDDLTRAGQLFDVGFDPDDPLGTPRGLAPGLRALENLARAARLLESRDLPLDVRLGELQFAPSKLPMRIPVHGGQGNWEGVLNLQQAATGRTTLEPLQLPAPVQGSRFLTEAGYPVLHGSSFILALEYADDGPRAAALLTYGQSGDPASERFVDQTLLFARKGWRPVLFRPAEIEAETRRTYTVTGDGSIGDPGSGGP
jgi:acyl-homoserine-lactone acylase